MDSGTRGRGRGGSHNQRYRGTMKRQREDGSPSSPLVEVVHYPSSLPFPTVMDADFPSEPYRSRNKDIKSSVHWGQRKLIISEIQFIALYGTLGTSYHIVYAGSAPGTHIEFLDQMFESRHSWELIDPGQFDREVLEGHENITLRNEFFTNAVAYGINARRLEEHCPALSAIYREMTAKATHRQELHEQLQASVGSMDVARVTEDIPSMYEPLLDLPCGLELLAQVGMERSKPLLFVSDIRTGNLSMPNFEDHVAENMRAQESWTRILQADYSMLKFRLPYTKIAKSYGGRDVVAQTKLIRSDGTVPYLRGDILLPIWTRPTSTEGRLVVPRGAFQAPYNVAKVEDQFFFFNTRVREQMHFNHYFESHPTFNHHFDPSAELHALTQYLHWIKPESKTWGPEEFFKEVEAVAERITTHLRITFKDAICRRDALMLRQAKEGVSAHLQRTAPQAGDSAVKEPSEANIESSAWLVNTKRLIQLAWKERERPVWHTNVDETKWSLPSEMWVTTGMPQ